MVLSQCFGVIKYTLVFVNLIFWVLGLTAVGFGTWMLVDHTFILSLTQEQHNYYAGLYITLVAGALLLIVAFLGCCGAFRESQCMLVGFFSCLLVVVVTQIAAGAWLYTNRDRIEPLVKTSFMSTVKNEYGEIEDRTRTVDSIQENLQCCGANGPSDWTSSKYGNSNGPLSLTVSSPKNDYIVPESCCKVKDTKLCNDARKIKIGGIVPPEIYSQGCVDKLSDVFSSQGFFVLIIIIILCVVELIGLIFSLILCCAIGSSDRYKA
ncbi:CD9 antigen-like [Microplitis mediator]|uniref:CD9 antigen-like n=1 Tax=Microplitis mediator TaxID=375433 RepID=UPI00255750AE|nr:CD9 antigen-like [Microplitis mediator]